MAVIPQLVGCTLARLRLAQARLTGRGALFFRGRMIERRFRIGLDIGGTFTDFILYDAAGRLSLYKCLTTPHDPSLAALEGLAQLTAQAGMSLAEVGAIAPG